MRSSSCGMFVCLEAGCSDDCLDAQGDHLAAFMSTVELLLVSLTWESSGEWHQRQKLDLGLVLKKCMQQQQM